MGIEEQVKDILTCICNSYMNNKIYKVISNRWSGNHYEDVKMGAMASPIISLTIDYSTVYSGADQSKLQCSVSLAFVRGFHQWPVNSPHKWPVTRKIFPFVASSCFGIAEPSRFPLWYLQLMLPDNDTLETWFQDPPCMCHCFVSLDRNEISQVISAYLK